MKNKLFLLLAAWLFACESVEVRKQRFLQKGNEAMEQKNYGEAIRQFEAAVKLDSCYTDALNNWGTALHRQKYYAEAAEKYSLALTCNPGFLLALLNRANTYFELQRYDLSLRDAESAIRLRDTLPAYFVKGLALAKAGRYAEAAQAYRKVLLLDTAHTEGRINLAVALYYQGKYDSARMIVEDVVRWSAQKADAWNTLSMIAAAEGKYEEAMQYIQRAIDIDPSNSWYVNNRGYIHLLRGETDKALADINQSIAADPVNAWAYRNKGIYYLLTGDNSSAVRLLEQALRMDNTVQDIYAWLAEVYCKDGKSEKACVYTKLSAEKGEIRKVDCSCK